MELEIGGKNYELRFGLSFINAIDNIYKQEMSGMQFGMGIEMLNMYLNLKRPTALQNLIRAGTSHLNTQPSSSDIETYLESIFMENKQDKLFEESESAMEQSPFLKQAIQQLQKNQKQAMKHTKK